MRLRVVAVLVGLSLVVVSPLGIPSAGATEPLLLSLSEEVVGLCEGDELTGEGDELTGVPEPEVVACVAADLSVACLSVKQPDGEDGSAASPAQELAPSPPGALAELPAEAIVPPAVAIAARYQVEDNHDVRRFLDQFQ